MKYSLIAVWIAALVISFYALAGRSDDEPIAVESASAAYPVLVAKTDLERYTLLTRENTKVVDDKTLSTSRSDIISLIPESGYISCNPIVAGHPIFRQDVIEPPIHISPVIPAGKRLVGIMADNYSIGDLKLEEVRGRRVQITANNASGTECLNLEVEVLAASTPLRTTEGQSDAILFGVWVTEHEADAIKNAESAGYKFNVSIR